MKINRRDTLKTIVLTGAGTGLILSGCKTDLPNPEPTVQSDETPLYGRTPQEKALDAELKGQQFFNEHELATLAVLCDLIIPADNVSGSATDAKVPEFIEFMMKDYPPFQNVMRGGLMWLDLEALELTDQSFVDCSESQQKELLDRIAYPDEADDQDEYGVKFFNTLRNLTATGFYTTELGFKDLDYQGNIANVWDGVPEEVLNKHGFTYEDKYKDLYVKPDDRSTVIEWDEEGNIIN